MSTTTAFFTDSTLCIGCKACEVACKEWNGIAADGFNWSGQLLRQHRRGRSLDLAAREVRREAPEPGFGGNDPAISLVGIFVRRLQALRKCRMPRSLSRPERSCAPSSAASSCSPTSATAAPTASWPVPSAWCRRNPGDGRAFKCTFCYDRQKVGLKPACATACPTESIKFGPIDEMRLVAQERMEELQVRGMDDASVYDPTDTSVEGIHAFFIVRGDPRQYNLPPNPEVPLIYQEQGWKSAAVGAAIMLVGTFVAFLGAGRK